MEAGSTAHVAGQRHGGGDPGHCGITHPHLTLTSSSVPCRANILSGSCSCGLMPASVKVRSPASATMMMAISERERQCWSFKAVTLVSSLNKTGSLCRLLHSSMFSVESALSLQKLAGSSWREEHRTSLSLVIALHPHKDPSTSLLTDHTLPNATSRAPPALGATRDVGNMCRPGRLHSFSSLTTNFLVHANANGSSSSHVLQEA